jgi:hypothetical protein
LPREVSDSLFTQAEDDILCGLKTLGRLAILSVRIPSPWSHLQHFLEPIEDKAMEEVKRKFEILEYF